MAKYRWLDDRLTYEYRGRLRPEWRGRRCRIVTLPVPGSKPANVHICFEDGEESIVPVGTLKAVMDTLET